MSTVAVLNLSSSGHINPSLPLVAELVRRGERVVYFSIEEYRAMIESTGAEYRRYRYPETICARVHPGGIFGNMASYMRAARANVPALMAELQADPPHYLLLDSMCIWGHLLQQIFSLPAVSFSSIFVMHPKLSANKMIDIVYRDLPPEVMVSGLKNLHAYFKDAQRFDQRFGTMCPGLIEAFSCTQGLNLLFTSREFHPFIELYNDDIYKFVGPSIAERPEAIAFPFERLKDEPAIFISAGTINNDIPDFYRLCYAAFRHDARQVIMAVGDKVDRIELGPPPENFIVQPYVPQLNVLSRVSVFVTHGGMNSTCEAIWHGVPLVVIPRRGDQFLVAEQVAKAGAGVVLPLERVTADVLRDAVERVLTVPTFRQRAHDLGQSFRQSGGYRRGVDEIFAYKRKLGLAEETGGTP